MKLGVALKSQVKINRRIHNLIDKNTVAADEMTNEEYKSAIRVIVDTLLQQINDNCILKYWYIYLREKERIHSC